MSYKIIVARYNENIEWLNSDCIIYNKGSRLNIDNEVMLDNVGRESDTYLQHIIKNYDNLSDVIVFTQARISDHIESRCDDINYLLRLKDDAMEHSMSQNFLTHHDIGDNIYWDKDFNMRCTHVLPNIYKNNQRILFEDWFKNNIDSTYPNPIPIYTNALFAVRKENILSKPIEYYKRLSLELNYHSEPIEAHFFERSWYYIFN